MCPEMCPDSGFPPPDRHKYKGMKPVRLIKHEAVPRCGSYEVRVAGLRSRFFYYEIDPSRRLRPEQMTGAQALELAKLLARGLSVTR